MGKNFVSSYWLSFSILVIGIVLRFLYLDSDPRYDTWIGYITDEGRWVEHARSFSLHGRLLNQDTRILLHFYLAPFYQLANYFLFELTGVSLLTSRLLSALCGSAVLILFWDRLRNFVSSQALLVGITLLAFQPDILALSRVAVPEMAAILMQVLIYFQIVKSKQSARRILIAGFLMLLAAGIKATTVLMAPIYSIIIVFMPRYPDEMPRWHGLMLFWTGLLLPIVLVSLVGIISAPEQSALFISSLSNLWHGILKGFIRLSSFYSLVSFPFDNSLSPTFNLWLLGLWVSAFVWMTAHRTKSIDFESNRYLVTAAIWVSLYFVFMLAMDYFPARYQVHILIPMTVWLTVGISLLQRVGLPAVINTLGKTDGAFAGLWLSFLCLPTAVILSPLAVWISGYFGGDPERLITKISCVILLLAGATCVAGLRKQSQGVIIFLFMFSLLAGMALVITSMTSDYSFWPRVGSRSHFAWYGLVVLAVSGISIAVGQVRIPWSVLGCSRILTACALLYLPFSLVRIAPGYISPHYSMRDTSRDLGKILSGYSTIATIKAEGLFNENNLRYKSIVLVDWSVETPDIVVMAFTDVERMLKFKRNYQLMKRYKIFISPEYPVRDLTEGVTVSVYKKNATSPTNSTEHTEP